ncbi:MAG TPA: hypothetical protein PKJ99_03580 [Thermoanaerobaculales bacterium]|nr:hypothetical protein [Thermoanaerobaculales bacterium]HPA79956.1 hypothetical protein [Thermoanaerobaculales bacterium]HQP44134.1 hypothetical protein [Thermoanaerobaculales bacterium]
MTTRTLAAASLLLSIAVAAGAAERVLDDAFPAAGVDGVSITNGVGDVVVTAAEVVEITVDVTLIPRRGGLFSSYRNAEQEVESARLQSRIEGGRLELAVESSSDEPRFEAQWVVVVPTRVAIELTAGVGDVTVHGAAAGVRVELGVGDALIGVVDGPVSAEVGVGEATVRGLASRYGGVTASGGVGDASILVAGQRLTGGGFVGRESSWHGSGPHSIELEVGVGEARIVLE